MGHFILNGTVVAEVKLARVQGKQAWAFIDFSSMLI